MKTYKLVFSALCMMIIISAGCGNKHSKNSNDGEETSSAEETKDEEEKIDFNKYSLTDLTTSHNLKELLCQAWDNEEDYNEPAQEMTSNVEVVSRGFVFFNDGRAVKDPRGDYKEGTWALDETKKPVIISIKYKNGEKQSFQVGKLSAKKLTLSSDDGTKKLVNYVSQGIAYKNLSADPFAPENNSWRMKPSSSEKDEQIKARLKSCIHFFILYYDHTINTKTSTVNFTGLPGCFRWYAGGIYLQKEKDISTKWINCFYNKEQAMKAYKMAEDLLAKKYKWPKGEKNWVKQNVFVLKQMEGNL